MIELDFDPIIGKSFSGVSLSDLASKFGLELIGLDGEVNYLGKLDFSHPERDGMLTYLGSQAFLLEFEDGNYRFAIIPETMTWDTLPSKYSYLVTKDNPEEVFTAIHMYFIEKGLYYQVDPFIGSDCYVSPDAKIHPNVRIGHGCQIEDYVVIYPNTIIGDNVKIGANTVIGGDGFEVKSINGRKQIVPHIGGTILCDNVEIGSSCTIDCSLRHTFTYVGANTKISNQVQVAHGASLGEDCLIGGHGQIGNSHIGQGVVVGVLACISEQLTIGDNVVIGAKALVNRSVPNNSIVYGIPAKHQGWNQTIQKEAING